jgi:hypothetical protein
MKTRVSALFLVLLALAGTTRLSVGLHYCMGRLKNVMLYSSAERCAMPAGDMPCTNQPVMAGRGCCENHQVAVSTADYTPPAAGFSMPGVQLVPAYVILRQLGHPAEVATLHHLFHRYIPPLTERDIPVLVQSFLI